MTVLAQLLRQGDARDDSSTAAHEARTAHSQAAGEALAGRHWWQETYGSATPPPGSAQAGRARATQGQGRWMLADRARKSDLNGGAHTRRATEKENRARNGNNVRAKRGERAMQRGAKAQSAQDSIRAQHKREMRTRRKKGRRARSHKKKKKKKNKRALTADEKRAYVDEAHCFGSTHPAWLHQYCTDALRMGGRASPGKQQTSIRSCGGSRRCAHLSCASLVSL